MKSILINSLCFLLAFSACQPKPFTQLTPESYQRMLEEKGGEVIDVRTPEEFAAGHLAGARLSDWRSGDFATEMQQWDKSKTYYLYCASGNRSGQALEKMKEAGFQKVYNLGAYPALKQAGVAVEAP